MGGTPRKGDKPRPSYEDGELRDPAVEKIMDSTYGRDALVTMIKKAVRPHSTNCR